MTRKDQELPYKKLGLRLRGMRERLSESVAEVSGAVEIEVATLTAIEKGSDRPSEDILLLLISHFAVKEDEATKLWELAGYENPELNSTNMTADELGTLKNAVMVMPVDSRIIYTDMAHVLVNDHGVVLNFMQAASGSNSQPLVVSRLGMSREHAESIIGLLQKTLAQHTQGQMKSLPAPQAKKDADINNSDNK